MAAAAFLAGTRFLVPPAAVAPVVGAGPPAAALVFPGPGAAALDGRVAFLAPAAAPPLFAPPAGALFLAAALAGPAASFAGRDALPLGGAGASPPGGW